MKVRAIAPTVTFALLLCGPTLTFSQIQGDPDCGASACPASQALRLQPPTKPLITYSDKRLTIIAENSTLGDVLRAIGQQTGAQVLLPAEGLEERVFVHLGPGSAQSVVNDLLNGSRFNYVMGTSPSDPRDLQFLALSGAGANFPSSPVPVAAPTSAAPDEPILYGQGFSEDSEDTPAPPPTPDPAAEEKKKRGKVLGELLKEFVKQRDEALQQQQASPAPHP
jgi:hypothetical protein